MDKIKITLGLFLAFILGQSFASEQELSLNKPKYESSFVFIMDTLEENYMKQPIPPGDKVSYATIYKDSNGKQADFKLKQLVHQKFTEEDRTPESLNEIKEDLSMLAIKNCKSVVKLFMDKGFSFNSLDRINFVNEQTLASGDQFLTNYKCNSDGKAIVDIKYQRLNVTN